MNNLLYKVKILFKSIKLLKNWYLFPLAYFGLVKDENVIFKTRSGFKIKIRPKSSDIHIFTENWLGKGHLKELNLKNGGIIIDVGSHTGMFSLCCAEQYKDCKILSFEPDKENYEIARQNIMLNHLNNIDCKNMAVSSKLGIVKFYKNNDPSSHSLLEITDNYEDVESTNLENIFDENKIEKCNLLKLDCEGAEYDILLSAPKRVYEKIDQIFLECHQIDDSNDSVEELILKFKENKFDCKTIVTSKQIKYLYAIKQEL